MWLEDNVNLAKAALPGRRKRDANFRRMVAVVIDYADAGNLAAQLEATVDAVKGFECRANLANLDIQADPHGNGRRSIKPGVGSGHAQPEPSTLSATVGHVETTDCVDLLVIESALR